MLQPFPDRLRYPSRARISEPLKVRRRRGLLSRPRRSGHDFFFSRAINESVRATQRAVRVHGEIDRRLILAGQEDLRSFLLVRALNGNAVE